MSVKAMLGPGRFQWNAGGWFGGALGGSAWMLVATLLLMASGNSATALLPGAMFSLIAIAAVSLWAGRGMILPFTGLMSILTLMAIAFPIVWIYLETDGPENLRTSSYWPNSGSGKWFAYLMVPALMLWFCILEFTQRNMSESDTNKPR